MRSLKVGLGVVPFVSLLAGLAACGGGDDSSASFDGDGGGTGQHADGAPASPSGGHDATTSRDSATSSDAGSIDSTVPTEAGDDASTGGGNGGDAASDDAADGADAADAAADSGLSPDAQASPDGGDAGGPTGSACGPENTIQQQPCGLCGTQERVCLRNANDADGGDAAASGGPVWQPWGFCQNQPANACQPGMQTSEACGLCGHHAKVCQLDCQWAVGACTGEPADACEPGTTNFVDGLSCDAGAGRSQTCGASCTWGTFGACSAPDYGAPLAIASSVKGLVTSVRSMPSGPTLPRLNMGACPTTLTSSTAKNAYAYVRVENDTAKTAAVSVWLSKAANGPDIDTEIAVYPSSPSPPVSGPARLACIDLGGSSNGSDVNDACYSGDSNATECLTGWGGLVADDFSDNSVSIAPHDFIWVYASAVDEITSGTPHAGTFQINVRTESLQ